MSTEYRNSEDELLVKAIHKTMGQMEQLKQVCLQLSVNADAELELFMLETRRLLDKAQSSSQEREKEWKERKEEVPAFIKNVVRPSVAPFVSNNKPAFTQRKAGRFIQKRSPQVKRKRISRTKRSGTEHVRSTAERTRQLRQPSVPEPKVMKPKLEPQPLKRKPEPQPQKKRPEPQTPKRTNQLKVNETAQYSGIITSSNLKRSL